MVDSNKLLRTWLLSVTAVTSLLGTNTGNSIYAGDLPENFDPSLGPAIQIQGDGGIPHTEILPLVDDRMKVRVWADKGKYLLARQVYGAMRDALHGAVNLDFAANGHVVRCIEVTSGQDVTDPDTGWVTVLAFYQLLAR